MSPWLETILTSFARATSNKQSLDVLVHAARDLGFEYCSLGVKLPFPRIKPQVLIFDNYTPEWRAQYQAEGYLAIDPTVAHGMRSVLPLVWSENVFSQSPTFWADAHAHGLHTGWAQACFNAQGVGAMLTLSRAHNDLGTTELDAQGTRMVELAQAAHEHFATRLVAAHAPDLTVQLHSREREVLMWTIDGKTAGEVGEILNLSERTVNHYIGQAMGKLNATNKIAAAMKAFDAGLL